MTAQENSTRPNPASSAFLPTCRTSMVRTALNCWLYWTRKKACFIDWDELPTPPTSKNKWPRLKPPRPRRILISSRTVSSPESTAPRRAYTDHQSQKICELDAPATYLRTCEECCANPVTVFAFLLAFSACLYVTPRRI